MIVPAFLMKDQPRSHIDAEHVDHEWAYGRQAAP